MFEMDSEQLLETNLEHEGGHKWQVDLAFGLGDSASVDLQLVEPHVRRCVHCEDGLLLFGLVQCGQSEIYCD